MIVDFVYVDVCYTDHVPKLAEEKLEVKQMR